MKTLLIATQQTLKKHAGKEVDDYMVVEPILMPDQMPAAANQVRNKIRQIVIDAKREANETVTQVAVVCDVTPPWRFILLGLAETMGKEERLEISLPEDFAMAPKENEKVNLV
jgi:hypothetical protein